MTRKEKMSIDFAFDPKESTHHFAVIIPKKDDSPITIEERFDWQPQSKEDHDAKKKSSPKVRLQRYRWEKIADPTRRQFSKRMRLEGSNKATWNSPGETILAPHFGRELVLLAWAIEDIDEGLIPNAVANWLGLEPEERWWLYTTVNATFIKPEIGGDRGWRKAIKIAFSENPIPEMPQDRFVEISELSTSYLAKDKKSQKLKEIRETRQPYKKKKTLEPSRQQRLFDD